jgi:hypothetical protein
MIYVCGAGPTGMAVTTVLQKHGRNVQLLEQSQEVGGTWAPTYKNGYFTHHSPQVISTAYLNTIALFESLDINIRDYFSAVTVGWSGLLMAQSSVKDKMWLIRGYFYYVGFPEKSKCITVQEYFGDNLSEKCAIVLNRVCYLLDGVGIEKLLLAEMYGAFDQTAFYSTLQVSSLKFLDVWVSKLNVNTIQLGVGVQQVDEVDGQLILQTTKGSIALDACDSLVFAVDPLSLHKILAKSAPMIQNNWAPWDCLQEQILANTYISLSVQLHFSQDLPKLSAADEIGLTTEWNIVNMFVRLRYESGSILSCSLMDLTLYSSHLQKTIEQCNPHEVKQEVWRQISLANPQLPLPTCITTGSKFSYNSTYNFDISATAMSKRGPICSKGKHSQMWIAGPLNPRTFAPTTMEVAITSGIQVAHGILKRKFFRLKSKTLSGVLFMVLVAIMGVLSLIVATRVTATVTPENSSISKSEDFVEVVVDQ